MVETMLSEKSECFLMPREAEDSDIFKDFY